MDHVQAPEPDAAIDRLRAQPEREELRTRDHAVLAVRKGRDPQIGVELTSHIDVKSPAPNFAPLLESQAMAGHSKWAGIKHKKAIVDARRGKLFTKLARAITVAAKDGGGDPDGNPALALAIQKARDASMPKDNIERAIAKGTGEGADAEALESVLYEGYGPGGVAILVEATTDNRNRTGSEVRHLFGKHGGNLGEPGSVAYLFDKKGTIVVDGERFSEDDLMGAIDAGAEDIVMDADVYEVLTEPSDLTRVRAALEEAGVEVEEAQVAQRPKSTVPLDEDGAVKLMRLIDALEDQDDVDAVHANFDVDAEILERVAG
jgi:YebC/PmpR family DNA-binding regulatory protein